jgi:hypothetical protein
MLVATRHDGMFPARLNMHNKCEPERWDQVKRVDKSVLSVLSRAFVFLGLCGVIYMSIEPRVM